MTDIYRLNNETIEFPTVYNTNIPVKNTIGLFFHSLLFKFITSFIYLHFDVKQLRRNVMLWQLKVHTKYST
jgi:hypothetical protein